MAENRIINFKKKERYKFGQIKIWRMANTVQKDCMLYVFMTGDIDLRSISFMYGML